MIYNSKDFTWGYEIEWGDIDRRVDIKNALDYQNVIS